MGRRGSVNRFLPLLRTTEDTHSERRAAIIGAGTVGLAVAQTLEELGWDLKIIERSRKRCEQVAAVLRGLVLHGDGADLDLLEQEHIGELPLVIAVTSNDEKNLLVSLLAKQLGVKRIVTRAESLMNERMFEKLGIDVVRSAHGAALRSAVRNIDRGKSEIRAEIEHGDATILELTLPEHFPETRLLDWRMPSLAVVGAILRGRKVIVPDGQDPLRPGDELLIFCNREDGDATREYFLEGAASSS
jgi:trk system potassium uptake protein TrkA